MAEERIYIGVGKDGGEPIYFNPFTREEAIKSMENAMSDTYFNDVHASEPDMLEKMAEAALDALIRLQQNTNK